MTDRKFYHIPKNYLLLVAGLVCRRGEYYPDRHYRYAPELELPSGGSRPGGFWVVLRSDFPPADPEAYGSDYRLRSGENTHFAFL